MRAPTPPRHGSDLVLSDADLAEVEPPEVEPPDFLPDVEDLDARRDERRRAVRRVLWFRIGVLAGVLALVTGAVWVVGFSPVLAVQAEHIEVAGGGPFVDPAAVSAVAQVEVGVPLVRADTSGIAETLEGMPTIESASVLRAWPNGLRIELIPREPVAIAGTADGAAVDLVGADGVTVASVAPEAVPAGLPWLGVDMSQDSAAQAVTAVLGVLAALPPELSGQVASVAATSPQAISFTLTSGSQVLWGDDSETNLKAQVLLALLPVGAATYDVSAPRAPITR